MLLHNGHERRHEPVEEALDELLLASPPPEDGLVLRGRLHPVREHHLPVEVDRFGHDEVALRDQARRYL